MAIDKVKEAGKLDKRDPNRNLSGVMDTLKGVGTYLSSRKPLKGTRSENYVSPIFYPVNW